MPAVKSTGTFDIRTGDFFSFRQATFVQMISLRSVFVVPNWENKETYKRYRAGQKSLVCIVFNREGVSGSNIESSDRFYNQHLCNSIYS